MLFHQHGRICSQPPISTEYAPVGSALHILHGTRSLSFRRKIVQNHFCRRRKVHSCCRIRHCPRLERTRRRPASREDREGVGGPAGGARAPRGHHPTPPAGGAMPGGRRPAPVASPAHHCAKRSPQCGSWAGRDAGWAGHVPVITSPRRLGRRAAAGHRPDRLGRGPGRPVRACLGARERKRENGAGMLPCALA